MAAGLLRQQGDMLMPSPGLRDIALTSDADGCEALLVAFLIASRPLWLLAATAEGILVDELIPDDAQFALREGMGAETRDALLLELGRRFSDEARSVTGDLAEKYIVESCRAELRDAGAPALAESVRRVSEISDQLGYDITAPRLNGSTRRIEAKGTRGGGSAIVVFLSRNEAERGLSDTDWSLVACRVAADDSVELVGRLVGADLRGYLPSDPCPETRWQSIRLELPAGTFAPGLPPA